MDWTQIHFEKVFCTMVNRRGCSTMEQTLWEPMKHLQLFKQMTKDGKVNDSLVKQGVKWTFNPPYAPHYF